jgi:hypothetical protein
MSQDEFDRLLAAMPSIAKVVNEFQSEDVQRNAFAALVQAMGVTSLDAKHHRDQRVRDNVHERQPESPVPDTKPTEAASEAKNGKRPRKSAVRRGLAPAKDLDLRPSGKQAFRDFVAEKDPSTINERNLAAVYYLENVHGENPGTFLNRFAILPPERAGSIPVTGTSFLPRQAAGI